MELSHIFQLKLFGIFRNNSIPYSMKYACIGKNSNRFNVQIILSNIVTFSKEISLYTINNFQSIKVSCSFEHAFLSARISCSLCTLFCFWILRFCRDGKFFSILDDFVDRNLQNTFCDRVNQNKLKYRDA